MMTSIDLTGREPGLSSLSGCQDQQSLKKDSLKSVPESHFKETARFKHMLKLFAVMISLCFTP